jgi:hypothetical protein
MQKLRGQFSTASEIVHNTPSQGIRHDKKRLRSIGASLSRFRIDRLFAPFGFLGFAFDCQGSSVLEKRFSLGALFRHNITPGRRIKHVSFSSISYVSFSLERLTPFAAFLVLLLGGRDIAFISLSNDFFGLGEESLTRHVRRFSL